MELAEFGIFETVVNYEDYILGLKLTPPYYHIYIYIYIYKNRIITQMSNNILDCGGILT